MSSDPPKPHSGATAARVTPRSEPTPVRGWQALPVRLANSIWARGFPFLRWFPIGAEVLRADLIAGLSGALGLVREALAPALPLAPLVGVIQIGMGAFKLGMIVNFISHPVIIGFINAAAIIIALSQLNQLLGIPLGRTRA